MTPFDAIYSDDENSKHVIAEEISDVWEELLDTEFGIPLNWACQVSNGTNPAAPIPYFNTSKWYMCELETRNFWLQNPSEISNLYINTWTSTGPRNTSGTGETFYIYRFTPVGVYTINVTRSFNPDTDEVVGPSSSYSRVFTVYSEDHSTYGCNEGDDGGAIRRLSAENTADSTININSISTWPNPVVNQLNVSFQVKEAGNLSIQLIPIINVNHPNITITNSYRPIGNYQETFYTSGLQPGMYLLQITVADQTYHQKIFLKN
ncbi:T9SS type A sorting domain-containing protein [Chondrinema litorale]|uniref:T9SS type A sorting domain-containing protein n=1 Tax=Chondrinema litorale TaxID=2994555 RepID=UPI002543AD77|nr:T9SS type A sorting domain-containing protein [Chondrinema litorale]UZR99804.1 T9SS type A sorting domain-containing protein [Chondrinema litorale]